MLVTIGLVVLAKCSDSISNGAATREADTAAFLSAHLDDPKALDDKFGIDAEAACASGADQFLRKQALHDFKWDADASKWLASKFDRISLRSAGPGLLTLVSNRAMLQNGFGAFDRYSFYCQYDVRTHTVSYSEDDPGIKLDFQAPPSSPSPPEIINRAVPKARPPAAEGLSDEEQADLVTNEINARNAEELANTARM